jgi:hypothetical protein
MDRRVVLSSVNLKRVRARIAALGAPTIGAMMSRLDRKIIKARFAKLKRAPLRSFPALYGKLEAPDKPGVYVIYDPRGNVLHVGNTPRARKGLAQRLRDHMGTRSSFTQQFKRLKQDGSRLRKGYKFRCLPVRKRRYCALLEAYAIGCLCPEHIGHGAPLAK